MAVADCCWIEDVEVAVVAGDEDVGGGAAWLASREGLGIVTRNDEDARVGEGEGEGESEGAGDELPAGQRSVFAGRDHGNWS